jgi:hypothetical protein
MWSLCNAVMTIREIFPWIDDVDRLGENSAPPPKGELFFVQQMSPASGEIEPIRRRLAAALFDVAMDFALMHEVGHLWNGHVDLLNREIGPLPLREMRPGEAKGFDLAEAQALEFDADSFAAQKVFARAYRENQFKEFSEGLLKDHRLPLDGDHTATWYFTWFAIYAFFRLRGGRPSKQAAASRGASASLPFVHGRSGLRSTRMVKTHNAELGSLGDRRRTRSGRRDLPLASRRA